MDVIRFSETSVHIRTTWRYIPEEGNIKIARDTCLPYRTKKLRERKNLGAPGSFQTPFKRSLAVWMRL
jgi:hypothetical protein